MANHQSTNPKSLDYSYLSSVLLHQSQNNIERVFRPYLMLSEPFRLSQHQYEASSFTIPHSMGKEEGRGELVQENLCLQIHSCTGTFPTTLVLHPDRVFTQSSTDSVIQPTPHVTWQVTTDALPECRICHEEADPSDMASPCDCSGTLKYAHQDCIQKWCNEKGNTICEICHQHYRQGYSVSGLQCQHRDAVLDLSNMWELELRDPRILALEAAQQNILELGTTNAHAVYSASDICIRSVLFILIALLLFRSAIQIALNFDDDGAFLFLVSFLLRAFGFLLPCYIVVCVMNM